MPETLTETELKEIEREADRLPTDYLVIERVLILDYYTMKEASAWTGHTQPAAKAYASVPALCRSLRAAWAELESLRNQQWCAERVIQWLDDPNPKPAIHAFTAGNERQIAYRVERLRAQLAQVEKERDTVWERAIRLVHGEAESAANRARRIRDRYGDEGADEESAETLACETARNIKRALERAARMDSEGITEEDIAETLNPTRYPENL